MRLLDKSRRAPTLEELGLSDDMRARLADIVARPTGALLVTGPTGSGKSTTLYAALTTINRPEINIITVEDPVEYRLAGVNQVQINVRAGLTFASALRSILRSDPDVVMVGEIRDGETAKISIEAALTGHFVLSTLHTNDAPSAITRLNEMGVEPFLTGAAVTGVLAQRLARKLCPHCCEMYQPSVEELLQSRVAPDVALASDGMAFYRKRGCPRCNQTGYKGRVGIYQLLTMTESIAQLAVARASREEVERAAMEAGHALALGRRPREGRRRPDVGRRARPRRSSSAPPQAGSRRGVSATGLDVAAEDHQRFDGLGDELRRLGGVREGVRARAGRARLRVAAATGRPRSRRRRSRRGRWRGGRRRSGRPCVRGGRRARARPLAAVLTGRRSRRPERPSRGRRSPSSASATSPERLTTSTLGSSTPSSLASSAWATRLVQDVQREEAGAAELRARLRLAGGELVDACARDDERDDDDLVAARARCRPRRGSRSAESWGRRLLRRGLGGRLGRRRLGLRSGCGLRCGRLVRRQEPSPASRPQLRIGGSAGPLRRLQPVVRIASMTTSSRRRQRAPRRARRSGRGAELLHLVCSIGSRGSRLEGEKERARSPAPSRVKPCELLAYGQAPCVISR